MGFDTHMILETVPVLPSTRQNAHQTINPTSRHYAEAVGQGVKARIAAALGAGCEIEGNLYLAGSLWIVQAEAEALLDLSLGVSHMLMEPGSPPGPGGEGLLPPVRTDPG
jgi:hypothetical protein